jgi:hypothetical protein
MITIWLVITLLLAGEAPVTLEDSTQPDLASCWARAAAAVERAAHVEGKFEFAATCSVVKVPGDPA